jgi:hypothetical protein
MMKTPKRQTPTYATKERKREREKQALAGRGGGSIFRPGRPKERRKEKKKKNRKQKCILVVVEASRQGGLNQRGSRTGI